MRIVVDTNIVFRALINPIGAIPDIIIAPFNNILMTHEIIEQINK
jgi:predicted nucleic acid-binding protein